MAALLVVFFSVGVLVISCGANKTETQDGDVTDVTDYKEYPMLHDNPSTSTTESSEYTKNVSGTKTSVEPTTGNKQFEESQNSQNQTEKNSTPLNNGATESSEYTKNVSGTKTSVEPTTGNTKFEESQNSQNQTEKNSTPLNKREEEKSTAVTHSENVNKNNQKPNPKTPNEVNKGKHKNKSITSTTTVSSKVYESNDKFTTIIKTKYSPDSNIAPSTYKNSANRQNYNKREVNDILNNTEKLASTVVLATSEYNNSLSSPNRTKTTKTKTNLWGTIKKIFIGTVGVIGFLSWGMYILMSVL